MKSKLLLGNVPELYGNILITANLDGGLFLSVINTNSSLANTKVYMYPANVTLGLTNDYANMLSANGYDNLNDKFEYSGRKGYETVSILIGNKIPDCFIMCKESNGKADIKQVYDLSDKTNVGKYLIDFKKQFDNITDPININPARKLVTITGINLQKGIVNDYYINYDTVEGLNEKILSFIKNNRILLPNVVTIEFQIPKDIEYDKVFLGDHVDLFKYDLFTIGDHVKFYNNKYYLSPHIIIDNNSDNTASNIPMSFVNNEFYSCYMKNGFGVSNLKNNGEYLVLENDVEIETEMILDIDVKYLYNPVSYVTYKYYGGIKQSEFINVTANGVSMVLISDYMPNLLQAGIEFGAEDNNYYIFNYIGSDSQTAIAFSKAWNETSSKKSGVICSPKGSELVFMSIYGGAFDVSIQSDKFDIIDKFMENTSKTSYYATPKNEHIKSHNSGILHANNQSYEVVGVSRNLDYDFDENKVIDNGLLIHVRGINNIKENLVKYVVYKNPIIGVMDIADKVKLKKEFSVVGNFDRQAKSVLNPPYLKAYFKYTVASSNTIIKIGNITYVTGDVIYVPEDSQYKVMKGLGNIIPSDFYDELEFSMIKNTHIPADDLHYRDIAISQNNSSDYNGELVNLISSEAPSDKYFTVSDITRTNEWLSIQDVKYDIKKDAENIEFYDRSIKGFTEFEKMGDIYRSSSFGCEVISKDNLEGFKFIPVLNFMSDYKYMGGIKFNIVKNYDTKTIFVSVDIPISDYRCRYGYEYLMLYYAKNTKNNPYDKNVVYGMEGFIIKGVKIKCSMRGMIKNIITFNQKAPINLLITESNLETKLVFIENSGKTVISNYGYVADGFINQEPITYGVKMILNEVHVKDYLYVSRINGVDYNVIMHYNEVSSIVNMENMECYQIGDFENDLENLLSFITFSNVKESINLNKKFIDKHEIRDGVINKNANFDLSMVQFGKVFSGNYNIPINLIKSYSGSTTPNIMGVSIGTWVAQNDTWIDNSNSINILDKYFDTKLNLID